MTCLGCFSVNNVYLMIVFFRGYKRFFRRSDLEASDYLKDNSIFRNICCAQTGSCNAFRAQLFGPLRDRNAERIEIEDIESPIFKNFLFANVPSEIFSWDAIPVVDILVRLAGHLSAVIGNESISVFLCHDRLLFRFFTPRVQVLLHFIDWDELPDMQELMGIDSKSASTFVAQHLLAAADRYALERLKAICESKLCEGIIINTVAITLALAEQHHCFQLKTVCLKFVALPENLKAVMQTDGFDYLKRSRPSVLTELLKCVARLSEHFVIASGHRKEIFADGCDANGRRVKQRLH
ncbi:hypothetical protein Bca4012_026269 [Brassica carinata]